LFLLKKNSKLKADDIFIPLSYLLVHSPVCPSHILIGIYNKVIKNFDLLVFNAVNTTVKGTRQRNVLTKFYSNNLITLLYIPIKMCDGHTGE
jgi:hypothetical protein